MKRKFEDEMTEADACVSEAEYQRITKREVFEAKTDERRGHLAATRGLVICATRAALTEESGASTSGSEG